MKKTLVTVLGTRPEIVKFSPLLPLFDRHFRHILVHTGQHYDANMDRIFFRELRLKSPRHFLNVGSASQAVQTGRMMERLEPILQKSKAHVVAVLGDTNSTLAGAIVAAKMNIPIAHVESGCRSFNRRMPEEINRIMVDHISEWLFAPDQQAVKHLRAEGMPAKKIHSVGNTGLEATRRTLAFAPERRLKRFNVRPDAFVLATIHRAENTDSTDRLKNLIKSLGEIAKKVPVIFPVHPRTCAVLKRHRMVLPQGVISIEPIGNLDFIALLRHCLFVLSDSGGIQEEAAVVNRPCLILRDDTEWVRLVDAGKNFLVGTLPSKIIPIADKLIQSAAFRQQVKRRKSPLEWGASLKILKILQSV